MNRLTICLSSSVRRWVASSCRRSSSSESAGHAPNGPQSRYLVSMTMTAKDKLRQTVEELSEAEAQDTLGFIVHRRHQRDALAELLERAPLDDEPTAPDEDEGVREAKEQIVRGEVLSADEIRREIA